MRRDRTEKKKGEETEEDEKHKITFLVLIRLRVEYLTGVVMKMSCPERGIDHAGRTIFRVGR